jgi:hypothetical protein
VDFSWLPVSLVLLLLLLRLLLPVPLLLVEPIVKKWVVLVDARTERHKRERFGALAANTVVKNRDG